MRSKAAVIFPIFLIAVLLVTSCRTTPTVRRADHRSAKVGDSMPSKEVLKKAKAYGFVDIRQIDPTIEVELRYGTRNNVTGAPLYPSNMPCLLWESTARSLARAQAELRPHGLGIKVWDGYRPPSAHRALWEAVKNPEYVVPANESYSWHCTGVAVDITLVDLQGRELEMPTDFDTFSSQASAYYKGPDAEIRQRVYLLQKAMRNAGFSTIASEWWHFQDSRARGRVIHANLLGLQLPPHVRQVKARN